MSGGTAAGEPMVSTLLPYMYPWGCGSGMALEVGAGNSVSLGTVNLSNPRAIFAVSPPRFTRSRVPYEAYVVRRTSTRPQVDSARASAATSPPSPTVAPWSWRSRAAPASAYRAAAGSAPAHTPPDRPCPDPAPRPAPRPDRHHRLHPSPESFPGNRLQPGGRPQEPNRDGKSRTLVLTATMPSPTIGSPDQTQKRAHCAKKHRPRRATAPDFPACAGVPEGDQETQNFVSEMARRYDGHH